MTFAPRRATSASLGAAIIVLDADDVVFAQIAAGLNLDQVKRYLAWIFQPVNGADRDIDRFVLVHGLDRLIHRHARGALHDDPVLRAVMMLLQRQPPAGLDDDTLDPNRLPVPPPARPVT